MANPYIDEAPIPVEDPHGQLHIVYSANGSWSDQYCIADLRLRSGGDPSYVGDWYKSNGCLFGSHSGTMMKGWTATTEVDGPGSNSFALVDGDIDNSPPSGPRAPFVYHAVAKGTPLLLVRPAVEERHVRLVGEHHLHPCRRPRRHQRHRCRAEVLRVTTGRGLPWGSSPTAARLRRGSRRAQPRATEMLPWSRSPDS